MRKILAVIGTRPQILKLDPKLADVVVNTSQHFDDVMAGQHLKARKIIPKYNLGLTSDKTGVMMDKIRGILQKEKPDIVVVYGDTNSTAAGSWAAAYENIPLAHIEAGLRSGDISMPEEINRKIADVLASWRFCPTDLAYENLVNEGLGENSTMVGDPLFDSLNDFVPVKTRKDRRTYNYCTIHRQENRDPERLKSILSAIGRSGKKTIFPVHPSIRRIIKANKIKIPKNVELLKPISRKESLEYLVNASKCITDSGGIQREAYWTTVPCIVLRSVTEWQETVDDTWSILTGANEERILDAILNFKPSWAPRHFPRFGANEKIRHILKNA